MTELIKPVNAAAQLTSRKPTKKPKNMAKPTRQGEPQGQRTGCKLILVPENLNAHERTVLHTLAKSGQPTTIATMSKRFARTAADHRQAKSWVRNSLRKLVRGGAALGTQKQVNGHIRSTFRASPRGKKLVAA